MVCTHQTFPSKLEKYSECIMSPIITFKQQSFIKLWVYGSGVIINNKYFVTQWAESRVGNGNVNY